MNLMSFMGCTVSEVVSVVLYLQKSEVVSKVFVIFQYFSAFFYSESDAIPVL